MVLLLLVLLVACEEQSADLSAVLDRLYVGAEDAALVLALRDPLLFRALSPARPWRFRTPLLFLVGRD